MGNKFDYVEAHSNTRTTSLSKFRCFWEYLAPELEFAVAAGDRH